MNEHIDKKWFERLVEIGMFDDIEYFGGSGVYRLEQKDLFLKGKIDHPTLDYPKLKDFDIESRRDLLERLKDDIEGKESNEAVKELYIRKIEEKLLILESLAATRAGDDERFLAVSKRVYGKMDMDLFVRSAEKILTHSGLHRPNTLTQEKFFSYIEHVLTTLPESSYIQGLDDLPVRMYVNEEKVLNAEMIKKEFEKKLADIGVDNWSVNIGDPGQYMVINVNHADKEIRIPYERRAGARELIGITEHEIGVHVVRRQNANTTPLGLLSVGLDRYIGAEEGVASCMEQKLTGGNHNIGLAYFAIGMILGMDGVKRDFREVFDILYILSDALIAEKDDEKRKKDAQDNAWNNAIRIYRGTTCTTRGVCFLRNKVYVEGNTAAWRTLNANPEMHDILYKGKFDQNNEAHTRCLRALSII